MINIISPQPPQNLHFMSHPYKLNPKQKTVKIGILGNGDVGRSLGHGFLSEGHEVMIGTRNPGKEKLVQWLEQHPDAKAGSFGEAAAFGELLVLAVKGSAADDLMAALDESVYNHKIIIDTTNPIVHKDNGWPSLEGGVLEYFTPRDLSLMEILQKKFPDARFVKAFNSVGNAVMYQPNYSEGKPTMFICGEDEAAKTIVSEILVSFGWDIADMGGAEVARPIEALCQLWCALGFNKGDWKHAFKLLRN